MCRGLHGLHGRQSEKRVHVRSPSEQSVESAADALVGQSDESGPDPDRLWLSWVLEHNETGGTVKTTETGSVDESSIRLKTMRDAFDEINGMSGKKLQYRLVAYMRTNHHLLMFAATIENRLSI